ncbi:MAG: hypothetical protein AB8D52_08005 [Gammaproteobacteria bacterium]
MNLKQSLIASILSTLLFTGAMPVLAVEAEMTDAEKAVELKRKEEQIRQLKEQARVPQGKDSGQDRNAAKTYELPQRRGDKYTSKKRELGNRDVNSIDLKEKEIEEEKRYRYSGLSDKNSVSVNNRLKTRKSGGVVGNTTLNRTRTKKVRKTSDKYKLGVQR